MPKFTQVIFSEKSKYSSIFICNKYKGICPNKISRLAIVFMQTASLKCRDFLKRFHNNYLSGRFPFTLPFKHNKNLLP